MVFVRSTRPLDGTDIVIDDDVTSVTEWDSCGRGCVVGAIVASPESCRSSCVCIGVWGWCFWGADEDEEEDDVDVVSNGRRVVRWGCILEHRCVWDSDVNDDDNNKRFTVEVR